MPERIQLSRRKGWRKPENTVVVARPSKWGNPYRIERVECFTGGFCWNVGVDGIKLHDHADSSARAREIAVGWFRDQLVGGGLPFTIADVRADLAGKNLACWCPPDQPCHADVLLKIANPMPRA